MNNDRFKILKTYWFILAVAILLLNDFVLKDMLHNWFTGKLSDFAGVFFLPLFFAVVFPKRIKELVIASALFFVYWKSPLSEGLINTINSFNGFNYVRVVDYTDLIALSVLPLAYYVYANIEKWRTVKVSPAIPFAIAGFAMMATSQEEHLVDLNVGYVIPSNQTVLFNDILANTNALETGQVIVRFSDSTIVDTMFFNINISQGNLAKAAWVGASLHKIDSANTEIYFWNFHQAGGECGLISPRCKEEFDDETIVLDDLETRFIDLF